MLDTALARLDAETRCRFAAAVGAGRKTRSTGSIDVDNWAEDVDRAQTMVAQQDFDSARRLLQRWTLDEESIVDAVTAELWGRTMVLEGDMLRDLGRVIGPGSAERCYMRARDVFRAHGMERQVARTDLAVGVTWEMGGRLDKALSLYVTASADDRLSARDRARATLWIGTVEAKQRRHDDAIASAERALRLFDGLDEVADWATAHQKLALAYRGSGRLSMAMSFIDAAAAVSATFTAIQQVRLRTARGHILVSDRRTVESGLQELHEAWAIASRHGLAHQRRAIESIREQVG